MIADKGLHHIPGFDVGTHSRKLADDGWRVFILPIGIKDTQSFFEGIRARVPLDPPVLGNNNWDALSDSLWGGLDSLDTNKIVIIWPSSAEMASAHPEDFKIAINILSELTKSLADAEATVGDAKQVLVVVA